MEITLNMGYILEPKPNRRRYYTFNLRVPAEVQSHIGKTKILQSLKTTDPITAKRKADRMLSEWLTKFEHARKGFASASASEGIALPIDELIERYAEKYLYWKSSDELGGFNHRVLQPFVTFLSAELQRPCDKHPLSEEKVLEIVRWADFLNVEDIKPWFAHKTPREAAEIALGIGIALRQKLIDELGTDKLWTPPKYERIVSKALEMETPKPLLSEVLEQNLKEKSIKGKTTASRRATNRLLIEWHGDRPIDQYTREDLRDFRDMLFQCPTNPRKGDEFKGMTLREIISKAPANRRRMGQSTVVNNMRRASATFHFAKDYAGHITLNPAKGLVPEYEAVAEENCTNFTDDHIQKLPAFLAVQKGKYRDVRFWFPLIALHTGMRLNEVCQLSLADFDTIDGVSCFRLRVTEGDYNQSLKTTSSRRIIPIHPVLLKVGLMDYRARRLKEAESDTAHLFPNLTEDAYGDGHWGEYISKKMNPDIRKALLTKEELALHEARKRKWVLHSLRGNFSTQALRCHLAVDSEGMLMGHVVPATKGARRNYKAGEAFATSLCEDVKKLDYGLDLSPIMGLY